MTVPTCRVCGCTDDDCSGCIERTGRPCLWISADLCSACADEATRDEMIAFCRQHVSPEQLADVLFLQALVDDNGYSCPKPLPGRRYACLAPKMFTTAIITGDMGDRYGIRDHWCFTTAAGAKAALDAWDGAGEPQGWLRHPASGRRVSQDAREFDGDDREVGAVGVVYTRA